MAIFEVDPQKSRSPLLPQKATLVANLEGWAGSTLGQPWYFWLSPQEVLLHGGRSNTEYPEDTAQHVKDAGKEGILYRLRVRSGTDEKALLKQQKPQPLTALYSHTESYGGISGGAISPDGRWLLYIGTRDVSKPNGIRYSDGKETFREYYWCALAIDGSREVAWSMTLLPYTRPGDASRPWIRLSSATWLPDSSGILETNTDWGIKRYSTIVTGQIRRLTSPTDSHPLPPVHLDNIREFSGGYPALYPIQMQTLPEGTTTAIYRNSSDRRQYAGAPWEVPPDQIIAYQWDWKPDSLNAPMARKRIITIPAGYALIENSLSQRGDRIAIAAMDRPHYAIVNGSASKLPPGFGEGIVRLYVTGVGHRGLQEIGHFAIPRNKESLWHQLFGLGDWLPDGKQLSFNIGKLLYTVPGG